MENDEKKRAVIVGIFVTVSIGIFVLAIFLLGSQQKTFERNIHINSVFTDVAGLKKGNNVWFSGVKVGTISNIRFIGVSEVAVEMSIDQTVQNYIHRNAGVKISSDGFIGNKIIVIDGGSPQAPVVEDGATLQAEKLMSTDDIMKTLQQNNQNLLAITTNFKTLSGRMVQGKGLVGALLTDSVMALQFKGILKNLQATTAQTAQMAQQLDRFGQKLNTKGGLADNLMTDTSVFSRLKATTAELKQVAINANTITQNLSKTSNKLNSTDNAVGVLLNDPKSAEQMRNMLNNLSQSSARLNEDLTAAQNSFLLKGYFKKQAKAHQDSVKAAKQ